MAITRIPEVYRSGFAKIKKLSSADAEALVAALKKAPMAGGLKGLISTAREQVLSLNRDDVEDILKSLFSLYVFRADSDTPLSEFASELSSAMRATGKESLVLSEEERIGFERNISKLLSINTVAVVCKVEQIKVEYANTFHDAKILSDIRPIFARPEDRPVGGAITHMLKIEFHHEGDHKEFYVALDSEDLQKMKSVFQRAETKASSLRSLLQAAGLPDLS